MIHHDNFGNNNNNNHLILDTGTFGIGREWMGWDWVPETPLSKHPRSKVSQWSKSGKNKLFPQIIFFNLYSVPADKEICT